LGRVHSSVDGREWHVEALNDDSVELCTDGEAANVRFQPERARPADGRMPEGVLPRNLRRGAPRASHDFARAHSVATRGEHRRAVPAGHVGAQPDAHAALACADELEVAIRKEEVGERAAGDATLGGGHPIELGRLEMHAVRHDAPVGEQPRTTVHAPRVERTRSSALSSTSTDHTHTAHQHQPLGTPQLPWRSGHLPVGGCGAGAGGCGAGGVREDVDVSLARVQGLDEGHLIEALCDVGLHL
jgi:hypothetical protein